MYELKRKEKSINEISSPTASTKNCFDIIAKKESVLAVSK